MSTMTTTKKVCRRAIQRGRIQPRCAGLSPRRTEMPRPVATRPLWMQRVSGSYNFFYFHDGNKNVSDLVSYQSARGVPAHYEYAPFGAVTAATTNTAFTAFNVADTNPYRFSSEYADDALGLVYYNYRHYNPKDGRWTNRDLMDEDGGVNLYILCNNGALNSIDVRGELSAGEIFGMIVSDLKCRVQATGSLSYTIQPRPRLPLWTSPPVWAELNVTVYAEISSCCDAGELSAKIRFGAAVEAYVAMGRSWKKQEPSHHDLKKRGLTRNSKAVDPGTGRVGKYKKHHSEVSSGFRDKWGSLGAIGNTSMPACPEISTRGVDWSIFVRGSVGLGVGYQFNIVKHFTTFDDLFTFDNITATGNRAWGVTGWSLDVGITADFYTEEKLSDFLK